MSFDVYAADPDNWPDIAFKLAFFLLIAFPVHEFFHAWMAYRFGDATAKLLGKLTLNPIAHFHPIGGWMLVASTVLFGIPLGFAATPVNPSNLRGRYGEAYVAAAGPLANFLLAAIFAIPLRVVLSTDLGVEYPVLVSVLHVIVYFDILLGLFNLIPVLPLDGGTVLLDLVPRRTAWQLRQFFTQYGMLLVIALIFFAGRILIPISDSIYRILVG